MIKLTVTEINAIAEGREVARQHGVATLAAALANAVSADDRIDQSVAAEFVAQCTLMFSEAIRVGATTPKAV